MNLRTVSSGASRNYVTRRMGGGGQEVRVTRRYVSVYYGAVPNRKSVTQWVEGAKKSRFSRNVISRRSLRGHPKIPSRDEGVGARGQRDVRTLYDVNRTGNGIT